MFGICLFAITYIGVRFYQSKDVTDIKFFNTHDRSELVLPLCCPPSSSAADPRHPLPFFIALPWASIPKNDGRDLSSVIARGDGIETSVLFLCLTRFLPLSLLLADPFTLPPRLRSRSRKFAYPKPKSFFSSKFEPDHYNQSASQ